MTIPVALLASAGKFAALDWIVVVGYLVFTTWLGTRLAGKQSSVRDFFLGGRKLPWYAVSGSIIATEISALTFVVVPFLVYRPGGNFTYLQLGVFGTFFARIIVGYWLVPVYYKREIYSPYDYMGHQLGNQVRSMTTALFVLGGILAQSARVYLTAVVLQVIMRDELLWLAQQTNMSGLACAIIIIGFVAIAWTLIGGIATVIWTDVMLFMLFLVGAIVALITISRALPGGFNEILQRGWEAKDSGAWGKFTFFDPEFGWPSIFTKPYTLWAGVIASTWGGLHPYGCDQLLVQRMFCCKGPREARWAMISSTASQFVTLTVALVGVGLFAYYANYPLTGEALELYEEKGDRIFPIFIVYADAIPVGFKGMIIAGIMAAAISSLTSILAALSQTVMSAFYEPLYRRFHRLPASGGLDTLDGDAQDGGGQGGVGAMDDRHGVVVGRLLVFGWGVVLCLIAYLAQFVAEKYPTILDLGLALAGYAGGALLAGFLLGFLPLRITGRGYMWSAPLSVLYVFACAWHESILTIGDASFEWTRWVVWLGGGLLALLWLIQLPWARARPVLPRVLQTLILFGAIATMIWIHADGYWQLPDKDGNLASANIAWPWYVPVGSTVAFVLGLALTDRRESSQPAAA